jgi:hypothetical protein
MLRQTGNTSSFFGFLFSLLVLKSSSYFTIFDMTQIGNVRNRSSLIEGKINFLNTDKVQKEEREFETKTIREVSK